MVARPGIYQASHNAGELAPELWGRTDIKQFYSGLSYARNVEPVPQGGARLSPRSRHIGVIRGALSEIPGTPTYSLGPHSGEAVLAQLLFAARPLTIVVAPSLACNVEITSLLLQFEFRTITGTWQALGLAFGAGAAAKTRSAASTPGQSLIATGVRLRLTGAPPSAATFTIPDLSAFIETGAVSPVRLRAFTFTAEQSYVLPLTDRVADVWRNDAFVAPSFHGLPAAEIPDVDTQQRLDTLLMFHPEHPSLRILRDGADSRWPTDGVPFTNTPQVDLGGTYGNAVADVWELRLTYPTSGAFANGVGLRFRASVDGEDTVTVAVADTPDWNATAAALKAAIEALPGVAPGITVTQTNSSGVTGFTITFAGVGNEGHFVLAANVTNTSAAAAVVSNLTLGRPGGEPLTSASAGHAACGAFYQDRLITGGFKSKKGAFLASVTGAYFDQNIEIAAATGAILANLDTDGAERLHKIVRAKHLVLFTTDAEYFVSDRALSATQVPNIVNSSRNGSAAGVPIVEHEGSLLSVSGNRSIVYASHYDDVAQAYVAEPISLLASHIVAGIVDAALQKPATATDAGRFWMVRDDGTMTVGILIRNQDVIAFVRWQTDGLVRAVCVDGQNRPHIAVERTVDGVAELHLERLELGLIFDGTVEQTFETPQTVITGLGMHEGATVWAQADGYVVGPFTVEDGAITLARAASEVLVGRWTAPVARSLPLPREVAERTVLRRPCRVFNVKCDVIDTTSIAIGANSVAATDVPIYFGETDVPPPPFTGLIEQPGLVGFSDEGFVEITQTKPGALQWRALTVEARI